MTLQTLSARQSVVDTALLVVARGLVAASWGNISVRISADCFAITPSGRSYQTLTADDINVLNMSGERLEGSHIPSSEWMLHRAIYAAYPGARAVIHTHSIYASALAAMRHPVPAIIEDIVQIAGGRIACAEYALPGTQALADHCIRAMHGKKAALLANHGAVVWGTSAHDALIVAEVLEKAAHIACICESCGRAIELDQSDCDSMHAFYNDHYSRRQSGLE